MSKPTSPYYFRGGTSIYHWELDCSRNHFPDENWFTTEKRPKYKNKCTECLAKKIPSSQENQSQNTSPPFSFWDDYEEYFKAFEKSE